MWHQRNFISLFEKHVKSFDKVVIEVFFVTFVIFIEVMFSSYGVSTQKQQKTITGSLNGCGILQTCLSPLEYIIKFPTKFLFNPNLGVHFRVRFEVGENYSLSKTRWNHARNLKFGT